MRALGLHWIDWLVILGFFALMLGIGLWSRRRISNTQGFYQGNRSFGRALMAFLNFGNITDAGQTAGVTSEIFRQGLQGVWFQNLVLFHTPFQWFIAAFQRRARYLAPGDMYLHRFESRFLAGLYAAVLVPVAIYANSFGYLLTGKTLQAMMQKPAAEYTIAERAAVEGYGELRALRSRDAATLDAPAKTRLVQLEEREKRGELKAFASYLDLNTFYIIYAIIIAAYTALGGLLAVAIIDVVQGVLILFLSLALIPFALSRIGGLQAMSDAIPAGSFELFGSSALSDYTWYSVAALALLNLVVNAPKGFMIGGAARDDRAARLGFVTGSIFKRFMMIGWAFTGLLAVGIYAGQVSDPTNIWGFMTRDLLGVGAIGLMIAAVFSANMDGNSTISLESSAAVIKNIYEPLRPGAPERRQMLYGRLLLVAILGISVFFAHRLADEGIMVVFRYILSVGTIVGPSIWLAYFWRRLNTRAVAAQMLLSITMVVVVPNLVPAVSSWSTSSALTVQTIERFVTTQAVATQEDVNAGLAASAGAMIDRRQRIAPVAVYFESVVRDDPADTLSPLRGRGLFRPQIWLLGQLGVDFSGWTRAQLTTAVSLFDATLPFIVLILLSFVTRRNSEHVLRDFYARIHTPAVADAELDAALVREKIENPELVERDKVFPGTDWEFWKPTAYDIWGFLACVGFVLIIIALYTLIASIGG